MRFSCFGHPNIRALHRNTLEFTRSGKLSVDGDCIVGVMADFSIDEIRRMIDGRLRLASADILRDYPPAVFGPEHDLLRANVAIFAGGMAARGTGYVNPIFSDRDEIVIRRSKFISERTLLIGSDITASNLPSGMVELMKDPKLRIDVEIRL